LPHKHLGGLALSGLILGRLTLGGLTEFGEPDPIVTEFRKAAKPLAKK
jgi:hypothetical protein